jgi:hypothetical protein
MKEDKNVWPYSAIRELEKGKWTAWDETGYCELGTFDSLEEAVEAVWQRAKYLEETSYYEDSI